MATQIKSNQCLICKSPPKSTCTGCQQFFCVKHYFEHRQKLSMEFDQDIVRNHDELLEQIQQITESNDSFNDLFSIINQWEKITIEKIKQTAENVRDQLKQMINHEKEIVTKQFTNLTNEIRQRREEEDFDENNLKHLQQEINQLQKSIKQLTIQDNNKIEVMQDNQIDWNKIIYIHKQQQQQQTIQTWQIGFPANLKWKQNGITIAGGQGQGHRLNQLSYPFGLYIDDDQNVLIADQRNHRIVEWKYGATSGQVIAGGNGPGNQNNQLNCPTDVIVDKKTDSLVICDRENRRVVRWPRHDGIVGETIIFNVKSYGLTVDSDGFLYVCDWENHEVRRWKIGETEGKLVAGGNGRGQRLDQLDRPLSVFVDHDQSVYVSDGLNHRVMKWVKDAKEGIVVAGGRGQGNAFIQLSHPRGLFVDQLNTLYVADCDNYRIMCWPKDATQGSIVVGGNDVGVQANQFNGPIGLSFDRNAHLHVVDQSNHRVQRFAMEDP